TLAAAIGLDAATTRQSHQPAQRAGQPRWADQGLDRAPKKAKRAGYTLVFADESGFRLLPMRVRTWALRGQTPRLSVPLNPKHLSVMGGMTLDGRWLTWQLDHA